jgi:GNAT superfamily N-acetyltransferase
VAVFRHAKDDEAGALRDLERAANLEALGHVFPPERYPFPDDAVLARWAIVLADPAVTTLVAEDEAGLTAFVAYDAGTLRHLAVRPDHWGTGLASCAMRETDARSLWCLEENGHARAVYEHLGWRATEDRKEAAWPPYPVEMRYRRAVQ